MAPKTRSKSAKAGTKDPNPKQTMKPKLDITTRENDSKDTKRCGHCSVSVRSEDTATALQDTTNAAADVAAEPLDSMQSVEPLESTGVPSPTVPEWNVRRRRTARSKRYFYQYTYKRQTKDVELEVASFLGDELVAATTLVLMKLEGDPN